MYISEWKKQRVREEREYLGAIVLAIIAVPVLIGFMWTLSIVFN